MSKAKDSPIALLITLLITLGFLGGTLYWIYHRIGFADTARVVNPLSARFSQGEQQLIKTTTTPAKEAGVAALADNQLQKASEWFEASLKLNPNDPETLIYFNNARLQAAQAETVKIAVSVPIGTKLNIAQEILRGVAQAQHEINQQGGINGAGLIVEIINDDNDPKIAVQIAEKLVEDPSVLAIVGHNTGDASLAAAPIYQQNGVVMISPTTFNIEVSRVGNYIFRAAPTPQAMALPLVDYMLQRSKAAKILTCYDSQAPDQSVFKNAVVTLLTSKGGTVVEVPCDYSANGFDPQTTVEQGIDQGATGIFLGTNINNFDPTLEVIRANQGRLPLYSSPTLYTQEIFKVDSKPWTAWFWLPPGVQTHILNLPNGPKCSGRQQSTGAVQQPMMQLER
jgi:branched-chain amino acid transport system substrate-binding protein